MRVGYAIVFVRDMRRAVSFYSEVVGLRLKFETSHWTEFATGEATWVLHLGTAAENAESVQPAPGDAIERPGSCRPGLSVPDLAAFHEKMIAHRVPCRQPPKEVFGARLAQYVDPDGLVFSVSENRG